MDPYGSDPVHRNAPTGRAGLLLVSLYSWTCMTLGVAVARFVVAYIHKVQFAFDDVMVLAGTLFYVGSAVASQFAIDGGQGKHFVELTPGKAAQFFKAAYATQMLQVTSIAFAKLSTAFLLGRVAPQSLRERGILFGSVTLWAVFAIFASAFHCGMPKPWEGSPRSCGNGWPLIVIIILNMASDILLTAWIFPILYPLNMDKSRQRSVGILFGTRAIVPLVTIGQVWAALKSGRSNDLTWGGLQLALFNDCVTSLSLIVTSIPRIKRFIGSGGLNNPQIHDIEIPLSIRPRARSEGGSLKLVPSLSTKFTTTVVSGYSKASEKTKVPSDWQKFVSMGSKQDDQNSTSSLFEHHGVLLQQEVTVKVEDKSPPGSR